MRRTLRFILMLGVVAALLFIVVLLALYLALRHEPAWYARAVAAADRQAEEKASDRMLQNAADLGSALKTVGDWTIVFTAEQINGWLAVDMPKNHPGLMPAGMGSPRVSIESDGITLAARYSGSGIAAVVSLTLDVYLAEENTIAARIRKARAGSLPWSVGQVVEAFTRAAERSDVRLSWRQVGSDPLALIKIPAVQDSGRRRVRVTALRLEDGCIIVGGSTNEKTP